ncbi:MAG: fibronectin type III-like domain-contianing protein, partial [Treponema sp.]|nr:fibronectin type III-like domain-contianing protein [Treponema sp.]
TSFRFESIEILSPFLKRGGLIKGTVKLTNIGKLAGEEVIQIYVAKDELRFNDPLCSLRFFKRVTLSAGESEVIEFELPDSAFETVNAAGQSVLIEGVYTVIAANAAPLPISVEKGATPPVAVKIKIISSE